MAFDKVKKKLGFGCMRLPTKLGKIDEGEFRDMADAFLESGFNYFDTARCTTAARARRRSATASPNATRGRVSYSPTN